MPGTLFVVSAPSGAGKTTIVNAALSTLEKKLPIKRVITYTTRPRREGETDGDHYHFMSVEEFKKKASEGFFLEWSTWYDHYYGSPASIIDAIKTGTSFVAILDRAGAQDILAAYPEAILVWIKPASLSLLKERLKKRGKDSADVIEKRLEKAKVEMEQEEVEKMYQYHLVNDDLATAVNDFVTIIKQNISA